MDRDSQVLHRTEPTDEDTAVLPRTSGAHAAESTEPAESEVDGQGHGTDRGTAVLDPVPAGDQEQLDLVARPLPRRTHRAAPGRPSVPAVVGVLVAIGWVFIAPGYWVFNVTTGLVLAISCLGLLSVVGWSREISLAQAGLTGTALYIAGYAYRTGDGLGLPFPVAAAIGVGVAVALSVVVALVAARMSGVYVLVLTLAMQFVLENTVFTSGDLTGGLSAPSTPRPGFFLFNMSSDQAFYFYVLGCLAVVMIFLHRFRHSRFGRSMIMVGNDRQAAAAVGVSPWTYKVGAFAISGFLAGVAGVLSAPLYGNPPGSTEYVVFQSLFYLAIPVLAGFDSLLGVVLVAVVFTAVPQALESFHISSYILGGIGLVAGVLIGPRGVSGAVADYRTRWRERRNQAPRPVEEPVAEQEAEQEEPVTEPVSESVPGAVAEGAS